MVLKIDVYRQLLLLNAGYAQVIDSLAALLKHRAFRKSELGRFTDLSKENRATTNSYLLSALDAVETNQAGRRFRQRLAQERSDDQGNGDAVLWAYRNGARDALAA